MNGSASSSRKCRIRRMRTVAFTDALLFISFYLFYLSFSRQWGYIGTANDFNLIIIWEDNFGKLEEGGRDDTED